MTVDLVVVDSKETALKGRCSVETGPVLAVELRFLNFLLNLATPVPSFAAVVFKHNEQTKFATCERKTT
jgi:hypothetical protein